MGKKLDLVGQRFNRLAVLEEAGRDKHKNVLWKCKCDCGSEIIVCGGSLRRGLTQSCGCYHRELTIECHTKHGLIHNNKRLYDSVRLHFRAIREKVSGYTGWKLDHRYANDLGGVVKFCKDLIALFPEECSQYETDKTLELDKDNDPYMIFRPEAVVFVTQRENTNNRKCTVRLSDGTPFADFCRSVGVVTCENGKPTRAYRKYQTWFTRHSGEAHPELVKAANQTILLYRKCLIMLKLRKEADELCIHLEHNSSNPP